MKPLLVGEDNPYGSDPYYALYPLPERVSGHRLCVRIMGLGVREYLQSFDRVNLCSGKWSTPEARESAIRIAGVRQGGKLVLLGAKVANAFGLVHQPFTPHGTGLVGGSLRPITVVQLPHPSGRCRAWNESGSYERAREILRQAGVLPTSAPEPEPAEVDPSLVGRCSCSYAPCAHDLAGRRA